MRERKPVFFDKSYGPIYDFRFMNGEFIQLNALEHSYTQTYFTPVVKIAERIPKDRIHLKRLHVVFASWARSFNIGHLAFVSVFLNYVARRN
jgi:hypothetical protein